MKVACVAHARGALRAFTLARSAWLTSALLLAVACGDSSEPEVGQDASAVVPNIDASITMVLHDAATMMTGQPGGTQGGGATGAGASIAGGATMGGSGGVPGMTGNPFRPDAGRIDAGGTAISDAGAADSGAPPLGDGGDPFAEVRQVCVDTINMYRATMSLQPIVRANATLEACSDMGAKYDGDMNKGHASTQVPGKGAGGGAGRLCGSPPLGAQNTCPGWGVGARTGNATLADALKKCLAQMWAEGEPPGGVQACKDAYFKGDTACFLAHGHWINMSDATAKQVSCGFYDMGGSKFWMNQDFASR